MQDRKMVGVGEMASSQVPPDLFSKRQLRLVVELGISAGFA